MLGNLFSTGDTISFEVYPKQIFGTKFTDVKVEAQVSAQILKSMGLDPAAVHNTVYPTLPEGSIDRYDGYDYLLVRTGTGQMEFVGIPWIVENTVVTKSNAQLRVTIDNAAGDKLPVVREALAAVGLKVTNSEVL